jgi:hypothetical protein
MTFVAKDRVAEITQTCGTADYSLEGAKSGFRDFATAIGNGNTCYYCATDGKEWEVGLGTVASGTPDRLARTSILSSSNNNKIVDWGMGNKDVFVTSPAVTESLWRPATGGIGYTDGSVGIGTSTPGAKLEIYTDSAVNQKGINFNFPFTNQWQPLICVEGVPYISAESTLYEAGIYFDVQVNFSKKLVITAVEDDPQRNTYSPMLCKQHGPGYGGHLFITAGQPMEVYGDSPGAHVVINGSPNSRGGTSAYGNVGLATYGGKVGVGTTAPVAQLTVKALSGQTANSQQWLDSSGNVLATMDLGGKLTAKLNLTATAPAHNTSAGTVGDIAVDSSYLYVCATTGAEGNASWKRVALSADTW